MLSHYFAWVPISEPFFNGIKFIYERLINLFQQPGEGHPGVICFIVLSGFCIHIPYASKQITALNIKNEVRYFYTRRFFRIFPLYWISILLGILVFYISLNTSLAQYIQTISATDSDQITLLNLLQKFFAFSEFNITKYSNTYLANAPLASVVTEIWLYLFYPLFFYFLRKNGWKFVFAITTVLYAAVPVYYLYAGAEPFYNWWLFSVFNYYIIWAIGAFISELVFGNIKINTDKILKLFFASLLLYVFCFFLMRHADAAWLKYIRMLLLSTTFGFFLYLVIKPEYKLKPNLLTQIFSPFYNILSFIGNISYSIYAIHAPVLFLLITLFSGYGQWPIFSFPILIVVLSYFTYLIIEKPTHELGKKMTKNF